LNIVVVGLFSDQAVLTINQQQRLLKVGHTSPEGVKLISATSQNAIIEVKGVQKKYLLVHKSEVILHPLLSSRL
jgi:aspartyl protease family protein